MVVGNTTGRSYLVNIYLVCAVSQRLHVQVVFVEIEHIEVVFSFTFIITAYIRGKALLRKGHY